MTGMEISQSELVRSFIDVGTLLTGPKPINERMAGLCITAAHILRCDQVVILVIDGDDYCGAYEYGLPDELAARFAGYRVPRDTPVIAAIEECASYLLFNSANTDPQLGRISEILGVTSVIIAPFTHPDGSPLGYFAASFIEDKRSVSTIEAEIATGISRIAQTTLLRHLATERGQEISAAMIDVADSERRRLSRDIHDDPLQRILGLRIGLEGFRERLGDHPHHVQLDALIQECRAASASLRDVMLRTHPHSAEIADLHDVLKKMVELKEFGPQVELTFSDERQFTSPSHLVPTLHRVAEQAAGNSLRHANAKRLAVTLQGHDGGTLLTIEDDGRGFDPTETDRSRLGVMSMRERTGLLGGTFAIKSAPGAGTKVRAWFPHTEAQDID